MKHFIQTNLTLKYGSVPRFVEDMATIVPFLASHGWTLAGAYSPIVGDLSHIIHLWELENLDCIPAAMTAIQSTPDIVAVVERLADYVVEERLQLVAKMPYSPEQ